MKCLKLCIKMKLYITRCGWSKEWVTINCWKSKDWQISWTGSQKMSCDLEIGRGSSALQQGGSWSDSSWRCQSEKDLHEVCTTHSHRWAKLTQNQNFEAFSLVFLLETQLRCFIIILKYNIQTWMGEQSHHTKAQSLSLVKVKN